MLNLKTLSTFCFLLFCLTTISAQTENSSEKPKVENPNVFKLSTSYGQYKGLFMKFNYERNLSNRLIAFGSYETNSRFSKSLGVGMKYKLLQYKKFEALFGIETAWEHDNSIPNIAPIRNRFDLKPSLEVRYNIHKNIFIGLDYKRGYNPTAAFNVGVRF